ncbi:MAG: hypothetical protein HQM10_13505 [Candidatus Riflebacteria bacterium]|nr:hypothetical protein [Candidatus Riflebacteria bacterium]
MTRNQRMRSVTLRCMRFLAEYFNFGIVLKNVNVYGEIIWPAGFRSCTEKFYAILVYDGLSYGYIVNSRKVIIDLILFLDANGIHEPSDILAEHNDRFIKSYYWLSPKGIETKNDQITQEFDALEWLAALCGMVN